MLYKVIPLFSSAEFIVHAVHKTAASFLFIIELTEP